MRVFTRDDATGNLLGRMRVYASEKIGPKQSLTHEGFLLCQDVPVARTGEQIYGPGELGIEPGPDGYVRVARDEAEVFKPEFLLSFAAKPVVNDHPSDEINPSNWKDHAIGTILNPRRGEGEFSDCIVADLLIYDAEAIALIQGGKREVSAGYDADYDELGPGRARQYNMKANHLALVEAGRCGPRCAIRDQRTTTGDQPMFTRDTGERVKFWDRIADRIRKAFKAKDEAELEKTLKDAAEEEEKETRDDGEDPDSTHVHLHQGGGSSRYSDEDHEGYWAKNDQEHQQFKDDIMALKQHTKFPDAAGGQEEDPDGTTAKIEGQLEEESPPGTNDKARKAKDSVYLADSFQETLSLAEILVPGIQVPTFDKAIDPKKTLDAIIKLRRAAVEQAYATPEGKKLIDPMLGGKPLNVGTMDAGVFRTLFRAAATMKKASNNSARDTTVDLGAGGGLGVKGPIKTPADLNKRMTEVYKSASTN